VRHIVGRLFDHVLARRPATNAVGTYTYRQPVWLAECKNFPHEMQSVDESGEEAVESNG